MYIDVDYKYVPWQPSDEVENNTATIWVPGDKPTPKQVSDEFHRTRRPFYPDSEQGGREWGVIMKGWKTVSTQEVKERLKQDKESGKVVVM